MRGFVFRGIQVEKKTMPVGMDMFKPFVAVVVGHLRWGDKGNGRFKLRSNGIMCVEEVHQVAKKEKAIKLVGRFSPANITHQNRSLGKQLFDGVAKVGLMAAIFLISHFDFADKKAPLLLNAGRFAFVVAVAVLNLAFQKGKVWLKGWNARRTSLK